MKKIFFALVAAAALTISGSCTKLQPSSLEEDVYQHTAELVILKIEVSSSVKKSWDKGVIIFNFDGRTFSKKINEDDAEDGVSFKVGCSPNGIKSAKAIVNVTTEKNETSGSTWDLSSMSGSSTAKSIPAGGTVYVEKITLM